MGKFKRSDKEYTREQRLLKENRQLKQELNHLRKQIARLDNSRFETLRQMVADAEETKRFDKNMNQINTNTESLKKDWACRKCKTGFLEIVLYSKLSETWYYRRCNACENRTKGKRYGEQVKGLLKDEKF